VITASGTIEAREVSVSSRVGGQLLELRSEEGSPVNEGDTIALIDHASLDIQLRQAEAGVDLAASQLELLRKGARSEDIRQAQEAMKQSEANLKVAEADAKRMRELAEKGSVTVKQRDDAEARFSVSLAQFQSAEQALRKVRQLARPEEIKAAEARLAQAQAGADLLRKTIADCTILSPVSGVVTHKPVEEGELITPGAAVVTITELDRVHLMIYVTAKELGRVKLGQTAEVKIDSFPGRTFEGKVTYIAPQAEFTPKNVQTKEDRVKLVFGVKIELPNSDGALKPGLPADATLREADYSVEPKTEE
jgi:HlyD family secretion protein